MKAIDHPDSRSVLRIAVLLGAAFLLFFVGTATAALTDTLVRHYNMSVTGGNIYDDKGYSASVTAGNWQNKNCVIGICPCGSTGYAYEANINGMPQANSEWTISLWANATGLTGEHDVLGWGTSSTSREIIMGADTNKLMMNHYADDWSSPGAVFTANKWYHLVVRRNATHESWWVNGRLNQTYTQGALNIGSNYYLTIGDIRNGGGTNWAGCVDEVAIWNTSLTPTDIVSIYDYEVAGVGYPWIPEEECAENWTIDYYYNLSCNTSDLIGEVVIYRDSNECNVNPPGEPVPVANGTITQAYQCDYCLPNISSVVFSVGGCVNNTQETISGYVDYAYLECCAVTGLDTDCLIDNGSYGNSTTSAGCGVPVLAYEPSTGYSFFMLIMVVLMLAALIWAETNGSVAAGLIAVFTIFLNGWLFIDVWAIAGYGFFFFAAVYTLLVIARALDVA